MSQEEVCKWYEDYEPKGCLSSFCLDDNRNDSDFQEDSVHHLHQITSDIAAIVQNESYQFHNNGRESVGMIELENNVSQVPKEEPCNWYADYRRNMHPFEYYSDASTFTNEETTLCDNKKSTSIQFGRTDNGKMQELSINDNSSLQSGEFLADTSVTIIKTEPFEWNDGGVESFVDQAVPNINYSPALCGQDTFDSILPDMNPSVSNLNADTVSCQNYASHFAPGLKRETKVIMNSRTKNGLGLVRFPDYVSPIAPHVKTVKLPQFRSNQYMYSILRPNLVNAGVNNDASNLIADQPGYSDFSVQLVKPHLNGSTGISLINLTVANQNRSTSTDGFYHTTPIKFNTNKETQVVSAVRESLPSKNVGRNSCLSTGNVNENNVCNNEKAIVGVNDRSHHILPIPGLRVETSVCGVCGAMVSNSSMTNHLLSHSSDHILECNKCQMIFWSKIDFRKHCRKHTNLPPEAAALQITGKPLYESEVIWVVQKLLFDVEVIVSPPIKRKQIRKRQRSLCDICGKQFTTLHSLQAHLRIHSNERRYSCHVCGKRFVAATALKNHILTHTQERPHECEDCGKRFRQQSSLHSHHVTHSERKPYRCVVCSRAFSSPAYLKGHMLTHSNEKPHSCDVCHREFNRKRELTRHLCYTEDSDKKLFACRTCGVVTVGMNPLKEHYRTVHKGEKNIECDLCSKKFYNQVQLKNHYVSHRKDKHVPCGICSKMLKSAHNLKIHLRIHTGEKPYACEVCGKCFSQSSSRNSHLLIHKNKKPYVCRICNKSFRQSTSLTKHRRFIHEDDSENSDESGTG